MQGYANGIWSVISSLTDNYIPWDLQHYVNLREVARLGYGPMELPNLIDFKVGNMPENVLYPPLSNKHPNFSVELVVYEAQVFGGELSAYFNEIESTLNDELKKDKPDYYAIRFREGLKEYADRYKRYASILTLLEELIYYHQTGKNPYTKWADGTIHRDSMMPRAHELLNNLVCKLLKVVSYYVVPQQDQQKNDIEKVQNYSQESKQEQQQRDNKPTKREQKYFTKAIEAGLMEQIGDENYRWLHNNGMKASLGYFLKRVFDPKGTTPIPYQRMENLFEVSRLDSAIDKALTAKKPQKWRIEIDALFND